MIKNPLSIENNTFETARKNSTPLILDGAMGSYLQQKGYRPDDTLWMTRLNDADPELISNVHKEYIDAGAQVITTNTFRTNPVAIESFGSGSVEHQIKQAVNLAKLAIGDQNILIAGSNAPAEDCYQKERTISNTKLEINHRKHIDLLIDNDVHFILNETQSHLDEIEIICKHCSNEKIPYVVSLYLEEPMNILSGESLDYTISLILDYAPQAIGFNCISPKLFEKFLEMEHLEHSWGFYLNCGSGLSTDKNISCGISPDEYIEIVKNSLRLNPSFIGSCCGSNPCHVKKIREYIDGQTSG